MVYRILVDGKEKYVEKELRNYSLEADNKIRSEIMRHHTDDEGATEVVILSSFDEIRGKQWDGIC